MILDIGADARVGLGHTAELCFPVAVEDDPVDVTAAGVRLQRSVLEVLKLT